MIGVQGLQRDCCEVSCLRLRGLRGEGLGFFGFRVSSFGFIVPVSDLGLRVHRFGVRVRCFGVLFHLFGLRISGFEFTVSGFGSIVSGFGDFFFWISGFGCTDGSKTMHAEMTDTSIPTSYLHSMPIFNK